jgi:hypothetical protein
MIIKINIIVWKSKKNIIFLIYSKKLSNFLKINWFLDSYYHDFYLFHNKNTKKIKFYIFI